MILYIVTLILTVCDVSICQYNLGICRSHLIHNVYDTTVTLKELIEDGDYTVLYTSGLKQYTHVDCARLGYTRTNDTLQYEFYTYIQTNEITEMVTYPVNNGSSGKFHVRLDSDKSNQYIVYHGQGVLLLYWCRKHGDDHFNNNIWVIAARTPQAEEVDTKKAVLQMLYHDDYRHLLDLDVEVGREEVRNYLRLLPCEDSDLVLPSSWE